MAKVMSMEMMMVLMMQDNESKEMVMTTMVGITATNKQFGVLNPVS